MNMQERNNLICDNITVICICIY